MAFRLTQKTLLVSFLFVFSLGSSVLTYLLIPTKKNLQEYEKLHQKKLKKSKGSTFLQNIEQARENVQKDIWFTAGDKRDHIRVVSESSVMRLSPKGNKVDFQEDLQNIRCWMENSDQKEMRYFCAKNGTYDFLDRSFFAKKAELRFYHYDGGTLVLKNPHLTGFASQISFRIAETIQLHAENLKASINQERNFR